MKWKKAEERDCCKPPLPERKRPALGTECKAVMKMADWGFVNRWVISKVFLEHNHELAVDTAKLITTYREIPLRFNKELEGHENDGIISLFG